MPDPPLTPLECPWVSKAALRNPSSASGTRSRLGGEFEQSCPRNKKIILIRNMNSCLITSTSKMDCGWTARPLRSLTVFPEHRRFESPLALMDAPCVRDANSITPPFFFFACPSPTSPPPTFIYPRTVVVCAHAFFAVSLFFLLFFCTLFADPSAFIFSILFFFSRQRFFYSAVLRHGIRVKKRASYIRRGGSGNRVFAKSIRAVHIRMGVGAL